MVEHLNNKVTGLPFKVVDSKRWLHQQDVVVLPGPSGAEEEKLASVQKCGSLCLSKPQIKKGAAKEF